MKVRDRLFVCSLFLLCTYYLKASDAAKRIYVDNAQSVVVVRIKAPDGHFVAQGSGFVFDGKVITNAHVVKGGSAYLELGGARIPATVSKIDERNDLAILLPSVELTASSVRISSSEPLPGESIFAIGNPLGLERTISEGIVSGKRILDNRELTQITSPISPGSSGGPVFNESGQVIGVAVGMLREGQNLNFAVPIKFVQQLLAVSGSPPQSAAVTADRNSNKAFKFAAGQKVYVLALNGITDLQHSVPELEIERQVKNEFKKRKQFILASSAKQADFLFIVMLDPASSVFDELGFVILPDEDLPEPTTLAALREAAVWQGEEHWHQGRDVAVAAAAPITLGASMFFRSPTVCTSLVRKFHKEIAAPNPTPAAAQASQSSPFPVGPTASPTLVGSAVQPETTDELQVRGERNTVLISNGQNESTGESLAEAAKRSKQYQECLKLAAINPSITCK